MQTIDCTFHFSYCKRSHKPQWRNTQWTPTYRSKWKLTPECTFNTCSRLRILSFFFLNRCSLFADFLFEMTPLKSHTHSLSHTFTQTATENDFSLQVVAKVRKCVRLPASIPKVSMKKCTGESRTEPSPLGYKATLKLVLFPLLSSSLVSKFLFLSVAAGVNVLKFTSSMCKSWIQSLLLQNLQWLNFSTNALTHHLSIRVCIYTHSHIYVLYLYRPFTLKSLWNTFIIVICKFVDFK